MNTKLVVILVLAAVAAAGFFLLRPSNEIALGAVPAESAREATAFAEKAYETYRTAPDARGKRACFAPLDGELTAQLEKRLDSLASPDFPAARVSVAEGDSDTYCVDVPDGGTTVRFIVERSRGKLQLAGCGGVK